MANKGLVIFVAAMLVIFGVVVVGKQMSAPRAPVQDLTETSSSLETPVTTGTPSTDITTETTTAESPTVTETTPTADTAEATNTETTGTETPVAETPAAVPTGEGSLLDAPAGLEINVKKAMEERVLGSPDAKVTIVEYASMTCPHCAQFHREIFPEVKARLIDTGKAMFIFREYPLDGTAMKASMMARCADHEKFFDLIEVIFRNQDRWIKAEDPVKALSQYAALAGMDDIYVNLCINNAELETALLGKINDGQTRYNITQTPTFIFNGGEEKIAGEHPVEKFEEIVNKLSAGK